MSEAANVRRTGGVSFDGANEADGNSNVQQQHKFVGYRPKLGSFDRALKQADSGKRIVPRRPDHIHNKPSLTMHHASTPYGDVDQMDYPCPPHHCGNGPSA
ncbi:hypothetical protein BAE44_0000936 [Dichanthelium oligosanthes]|uniref:Uncharacterized protein n=1 Tax=Dichanthelium oligosanthes TaxID=888268 RepID=A0A1E5WKT4_9POAL|nr:hypothetical protein BAE44_0000936 [Dichanthelium oligosanthes]